jgi:CRP/FNR family cyclic AMP-dependent transcriptional regulator
MDAARATRILDHNPWFAALPRALANAILRVAKIRRVKDAVVFAVGDEPNGLFAVLSGCVHISHSASDGRLALLLVADAGTWFGETSVLDGGPRYSDALAVGPCELLHLDMAEFRRLSQQQVAHYAAFAKLLCNHHRLAMDHIAGLGALPVAVRLAQRLLFFARPSTDGRRGDEAVPLSQEQLASVVGVSRQALSAHLKDLERRGIIALGYRTIILRRRMVLQQMVNAAAGTASAKPVGTMAGHAISKIASRRGTTSEPSNI